MATVTVMPATKLEWEIRELIEGAKARTGLSMKEISEKLGYYGYFLSNYKSKKRLHSLPLDVVMQIAAMAGRKIEFKEVG